MDFLLLLGGKRPRFPRRGIASAGAWPAFEVVPVAGGELGFTATTYPGFAPVVDDTGATLVLGDPLFDWVRASVGSSGRTEQVAARLADEPLSAPAFRPYHSATIVRCAPPGDTPRGMLAELRTDSLGGSAVFVSRGRGFVAVSSSPDLVALATGDRLDLLACRELVSQSRVTFPYTLYEGVREVRPGAVITVRCGRAGVRMTVADPQPANVGAPLEPVASAAEASGFVGDLLHEFFTRMQLNLGGGQAVACTLSAGLDSRTILAAAMKELPGELTAITGSPDENPELWTAREVASRLGVRHQTATWDPAPMIDRFRTGNGLLFGSHRRWSDANLQGASRLFDFSVVLGGFFSSATMDGDDGQLKLRRERVADGSIPAGSHWSVISANFLELDAASRARLIRRAEASRRRLGPRFAAVGHFRYSFPATRGLFPAHWIALGHEWAQYEPLVTEGGFAIAVACRALGGPGRKESLFAEILEAAGLADVPANPETDEGGRSRAWLSAAEVLAGATEFVAEYRRMNAAALRLLGIDGSAVRLRHLLVNVYWANRLVTKWAPARRRGIRGRRAAARRPRRPPAS